MLNGLQPTRGEPLPFAEDVHIRAFTIEPLDLVVYAAPGVSGTARAQYLNHWHEAKFGGAFADAPLRIHAADAPWVDVPVITFDGAGTGDGLERIPIPGHTPGATAYLWNGHLFTGDSLFLDGDEWRVAVLDSSDRQAYVDSLERLKTVEFDYLVPWAASASGPWYSPADDRVARLDAILDRVRRGEDR